MYLNGGFFKYASDISPNWSYVVVAICRINHMSDENREINKLKRKGHVSPQNENRSKLQAVGFIWATTRKNAKVNAAQPAYLDR